MSRLGKFLYLFAGLSLISFVVVRFLLGAWVPFLWVALGLFAACVAGAFFIDRAFYREFLTMKTTKRGMSMGAMILMVVVLITAVNFIGARRYKTWDLSLNKVNTLSDQSIQLVKSLEDDLKVMYFYRNGTEGVEQNRRMFIDLIRKYQDQSPRVKLQFVEVNERPDLTEKYDIKKGTQAVLLEYKGRTNLIEKIDEQEMTSALVKVTREQDKKVFLLSGHRELGTDPQGDGQSVSMLKQLLEGNRYTVQTFSLTTAPDVPADADVVIVPGPQQAFIDAEITALENFLKRGGSLILALESKAPTRLDPLLAKVGVQAKGNLIATVLETPMGRAVDPRFTRGSVFSSESRITSPFGRSEYTVFRLPQALVKTNPPAGVTVEEIVRTNESAMAFSDATFQNGGEKGPFTLGMEVKGKFPGAAEGAPPFTMLVFGDAEFLNDQYLYQNLNRDLLLNSVAALAKEENLISITPKEVAATPLQLTDTQFILFIFGFIIPLPVLLFVGSGVLWFRRRHA